MSKQQSYYISLTSDAHAAFNVKVASKTEMEKAKAQVVKTQVNIQDNSALPFGQGNYGALLQKLLKEE